MGFIESLWQHYSRCEQKHAYHHVKAIVGITFNVTGVGTCDLILETKLASNIIPPDGTSVEEIAHKTVNGFFGPIQLNAYPKKLMVGESVNISGLIATAQANVTVTIFYKLEEEMQWHILEKQKRTSKETTILYGSQTKVANTT